MLWDILFRGQLGFSMSFLEEMWSRNLSNLMISPLRPIEFVCALMIMSLIRLAIGMVPVTFLAIAFFGFNVYGLGLALAAFFVNLILTSWAVGIVVAAITAFYMTRLYVLCFRGESRLTHEAVRALAQPDVRKQFAGQGMEVVANTPDELAAVIRNQIEDRRKLIAAAKIELQ